MVSFNGSRVNSHDNNTIRMFHTRQRFIRGKFKFTNYSCMQIHISQTNAMELYAILLCLHLFLYFLAFLFSPSVEVSSQQKGGVRDVSLGGVIIGALLVGMLLGVLFGVLITSVLVRRARNSRREEMAELERRRDEMAELERRREEMAELERKEIRRGSVEGDGTGRLRQGEQASSRSTLPAHIAVMITNPSAPDLPLQETPPETPSPCPSQSSSS